jgi:acetyl esterase/lipase
MFSKQTYTYKIASGCNLQADVYRPPGQEVWPAVLWLHGGALIFGDRQRLAPDQLARYLEAGYTVVAVDYRLAPEAKLEAIIADLQDAYHWLQQQGPALFQIDPGRIAVIGHSAGGYLTLMAGFRVNPPPAALVSFYGYGDITGSWYSRPDPFYCQQPAISQEQAYQAVGGPVLTGTSLESSRVEERYRFYLYCRQQGLWPQEVAGHDPAEENDWFDPFCPIRNITPAYPPTLLIHGDQDTDVPFEQSVLMSRELERHRVQHELLTLPGQGHGFDHAGLQNPLVSRLFDRIVAFLAKQG